ncbi:hypothetical protein LSUB1_G007776 [Lachnellula subtilissima]|uniref:Uncharacterized protein n=1 Tax=Lachnellula subtilissima TaxID=602034 RepID=A0A8H8RAP1_9HELO|nr:hypothetical protein LSUB1_G007776 [Lachnellula subtilissima]
MRRRQEAVNSSSDDETDPGSCFDTENEDSDFDTNLTNIDTDVEPDNDADLSWIAEFDIENYKDNNLNLFDVIKGC